MTFPQYLGVVGKLLSQMLVTSLHPKCGEKTVNGFRQTRAQTVLLGVVTFVTAFAVVITELVSKCSTK